MQIFKVCTNQHSTGFVCAALLIASTLLLGGCDGPTNATDSPRDSLVANTGDPLGDGLELPDSQIVATQTDNTSEPSDETPSKNTTQNSGDASAQPDDSTGYIDDGETPVRDPVRVQKRQIVSKNGVLELTFDDLKFDFEIGDEFERDMLTEEIEDLDGKQIKIRGYIQPSYKQSGLKSFIFVRDDKECCFGPQAAIFDCMVVKLKKGTSTEFTVRPVSIEGKLYLKEFDGPDGAVWAIYRIRNAKVN